MRAVVVAEVVADTIYPLADIPTAAAAAGIKAYCLISSKVMFRASEMV